MHAIGTLPEAVKLPGGTYTATGEHTEFFGINAAAMVRQISTQGNQAT